MAATVSRGFGVWSWVTHANCCSCHPQLPDSSISQNMGWFRKQLGKRTHHFQSRCTGCFTRNSTLQVSAPHEMPQTIPARHSSRQPGAVSRCHRNISGLSMAKGMNKLADLLTPTFTLPVWHFPGQILSSCQPMQTYLC